MFGLCSRASPLVEFLKTFAQKPGMSLKSSDHIRRIQTNFGHLTVLLCQRALGRLAEDNKVNITQTLIFSSRRRH